MIDDFSIIISGISQSTSILHLDPTTPIWRILLNLSVKYISEAVYIFLTRLDAPRVFSQLLGTYFFLVTLYIHYAICHGNTEKVCVVISIYQMKKLRQRGVE